MFKQCIRIVDFSLYCYIESAHNQRGIYCHNMWWEAIRVPKHMHVLSPFRRRFHYSKGSVCFFAYWSVGEHTIAHFESGSNIIREYLVTFWGWSRQSSGYRSFCPFCGEVQFAHGGGLRPCLLTLKEFTLSRVVRGGISLAGIRRRIPTPDASKWSPDSHHPTQGVFLYTVRME